MNQKYRRVILEAKNKSYTMLRYLWDLSEALTSSYTE